MVGDDQARSCKVAAKSARGTVPARIASQVFQWQVGFSNTRVIKSALAGFKLWVYPNGAQLRITRVGAVTAIADAAYMGK